MRKIQLCTLMIFLLLVLGACGSQGESEDALALRFRTDYLDMNAYEGQTKLTVDYGERVYEYSLDFRWQKEGDLRMEIVAPEILSGVVARISQGETFLEFDGAALETGPLSAEGLSPIDGIPAVITYLQEGYIAECGSETLGDVNCLRLQFRQPGEVAGQGAEATVWLDQDSGALKQAHLLRDGFTVLRCDFTAFSKT